MEFKKHGFKDEIIDQFMEDFPSKRNAAWWYSRSVTFYDILNRAFRQRNIRVLLLFGSFLQNLHHKLRERQQQLSGTAKPVVTVHRGQVLSYRDLEKLIVGCSVRSNAFFSTSAARLTANKFLATTADAEDLRRVIFSIEIDYRDQTAVFANIAKFSYYPREKETLFMANTRFVIHSRQEKDASRDSPSCWLIELKLQSDSDILRDRQLETESKRKTVKNCLNALSDMSEMIASFEDAVVFDILMEIYPEEAKWIQAMKFYALAELEAQCCDDPRNKKYDYSSALSYYEQALAIWREQLDNDDDLNCSFDIAENYFAIAQLYECGPPDLSNLSIGYLVDAVSSYELALEKCSTKDYEAIEIVFKLCGICRDLAKIDSEKYGLKSIAYQQRWIELLTQRTIPPKPKSLAGHYEDLAERYATIQHYDDVLIHYKRALEVYLSNSVEEDLFQRMIDVYKKIAIVYTHHKDDFHSALHYELLRHTCYLKHLMKSEIPLNGFYLGSLADSHSSVADCYLNTWQYIPAYKHLLKALVFSEERKDFVLKEGRLVFREGRLIYASDGQPLREPCQPDDKKLEDCDSKLRELEEKLKNVEKMLENEYQF
ncbi:unnamed protein product [Adineta ricciae]|uniref:NAD(P)(+)--arginine ADP-ribosyltransferase n=1 Tax=Adineta ricciae TaxID=249248 RepID=A0A813XAB6_ADIRI|nr:unnamed protein product [Adineta ricciae]CAF1467653.1 unnamed protein product [Adineta ricciae]